MDRNYIDSHHIVARYLADQLSEDDRHAFERYMDAIPTIVQDLEMTARLKVGLHTLDVSGALPELIKRPIRLGGSRLLAMAASIAAIAIGFFLWTARESVTTPVLTASLTSLIDHDGKTLVIANTYAILRTRSVTGDAEIELPPSQQAIELRVLPEVVAHPARYHAQLFRITDDGSVISVADTGGLLQNDEGFVVLYFDSSRLAHGRYQLTINGDAGTDSPDKPSAFRLDILLPAVPGQPLESD